MLLSLHLLLLLLLVLQLLLLLLLVLLLLLIGRAGRTASLPNGWGVYTPQIVEVYVHVKWQG